MGYMEQLPLIQTAAADRTSRVVDQRKKESLLLGKKLTRFGQLSLWFVGVWDLRARGNKMESEKIVRKCSSVYR